MGWGIGDVWDAATDLAEDGVDIIVGAAEDIGEALEDVGEAVVDLVDDALEQIEEYLDDIGEALGELGDDIADFAEEAWDDFEELADDAWDTVSSGVEDAWESLADGMEQAWEAAASFIEDSWQDLGEFADDVWEAVEEGVEAGWNSIQDGLEEAWDRAVAIAEGAAGVLADMVEMSIEVMSRVVEFVVDLVESAIELIKQLGACIAGIVMLRIVKIDNIVENFWKVPRQLPVEYRTNTQKVFGDNSFWNVWYIEDARLAADWYNDTTTAMTMSGVTMAGVTLTHLIFLTEPWDQFDNGDRRLMAHELIHVLQYRRLITDPAFGCAYGVGYMEAGFDYAKNPMEAVAFKFASDNAAALAI